MHFRQKFQLSSLFLAVTAKRVALCLTVGSAVMFAIPSEAFAIEKLLVSVADDGAVTLDVPPSVGNPIPNIGQQGAFSYRLYRGEYPDQSHPVSNSATTCSGFDASWFGDQWEDFIGTQGTNIVRSNNASTTGSYWYAICQNPSADTPTFSVIDYYFEWFRSNDGTTHVDPVPQLYSFDYTGAYMTRFVTGVVSGSKTSVNFNISYFLNLAEYDAENRPDMIGFSIVQDGGTGDAQVSSQNNLILPLSQGTSSKVFVSPYSHAVGSYIATFYFQNLSVGKPVFTASAITIKYTIDNGGVTSYTILQNENGLENGTSTNLEVCNLLDIGCQLRNAAKYLFVPSQSSITQSLGAFSSSSIPWVASAYASYELSQDYLNSGLSPEASTYSIHYDFSNGTVPNLDIQFFALSDVVSRFGDNAAIPRNIILTLLIISLFYMVFNTVNNILSVWAGESNRLKR